MALLMHAKMEVNFVVMQFTHVSGIYRAQTRVIKKKIKLSLDKMVLLMWSQILGKIALLAVNVGCFY